MDETNVLDFMTRVKNIYADPWGRTLIHFCVVFIITEFLRQMVYKGTALYSIFSKSKLKKDQMEAIYEFSAYPISLMVGTGMAIIVKEINTSMLTIGWSVFYAAGSGVVHGFYVSYIEKKIKKKIIGG